MKNKSLTLLCVLVLGTTAPFLASAESIDDKIDAANSKIEVLQQEKSNAEAQLVQINTEIANLTKQVDETLSKKNKLEEKLQELDEEIRALKAAIEKRNVKITEQVRIMQIEESGNRYIDAILESDSISDAITRTIAFTRLSTANNEIIVSQREDQTRVEEAQSEVENKITEVTKLTNQLKDQQATVEVKQQEQVVLAAAVAASLNTEVSNKNSLVEEKKAEEARRAEAARLLKEAQEKQAREEAEAKKLAAQVRKDEEEELKEQAAKLGDSNPTTTTTDTGGSNVTPPSGNSVTPPSANTNGFIVPTTGFTVTSGFGGRVDPTGNSGNQHNGIDLAAPLNTPIMAARAGEVVSAYYDGSGGNLVIIKHDNGYYTYYMHMNVRYAQAGQQVAAGEVLGLMGTTGDSTGVHLHFGISTGLWLGFLNPAPFIGL